ncbi:MAG: TonB-dependent receptor [Lewinellaceae bacterium]|nr:TonB-dependent receptor [Phaeodactylibacter sp.]MCB9040682.1 TonB-dependent receptor [Lewinellaceae bacterium]
MKNFLRFIVVLMAMLVLAGQAWAQGTVKGSAKDDNGEPLIGATVLLVGTSRGTATDFDGNYVLENVPAGEQQLMASYTGYADQSQTVMVLDGQEVTLNFQLGEDVEVLEEVVVIGYGSIKKDDATGAVNAVSDESFNRGAIISPDQLITGKIAGVQITANSGEPGGQSSIRIRGGTSVNANNEPLYVIDGVPIDNAGINPGGFQAGRNPLNFLNPEDIETFTVLKDASATAIYGSRGANGVIMITTKRGKAGDRPRISYNAWVSVADAVNTVEVLNADQFRSLVTSAQPENLKLLQNADTDWQNEVLQSAFGQNHNLSLMGGGESFGYRASIGYLNQDGILRTSNTERTNFSLNYNHNMLDNSLKVNFNLKGAFTKDRISPNGVIGAGVAYNPTLPILDPGSIFAGYYEYPISVLNAGTNPVSELEQTLDQNEGVRGLGNMEINYELPFVKGLSAKVNVGFDINKGERSRFLPSTIRYQLNSANPGEVRAENYTRISSLLETYLTYDKPLESIDSRLNFLAGYSYQDFNNSFPSYVASGLPNDFFGANNPSGAAELSVRNSVIENRLISFFGRVNFDVSNKYLFTATVRRDGSSRFGPNNRWGVFPSAALGWKISEEPFMEGALDVLSSLKLRLGWGITGNQEIGDYNYLARYLPGDALAQYQFGNGFVTTLRPTAFDPNLKWEETQTLNAGIDFDFLSGRFGGSIDVYQKKTDDLLFTVNVPAGTNLANRVLTNIGSLENKGIELALNGYVVDSRSFQWNLGFNVAYNRNEITKTIGDEDETFLGIQYGGISGGTGTTIQVLRKGESVNSFFVYEHILDANGLPRSDKIDYNEDGAANLLDIYIDQNGDGTINESDRIVYESALPNLTYGLTSRMNYKNFDLNFTLRASTGNFVYNNVLSGNSARQNVTNQSSPPSNLLVRGLLVDFEAPQYLSDYYVEDASFLRMDNITLGYNFPIAGKGISLRLYATAQNLFVLTDYTGLDPEIGNRAGSGLPELGIDRDIFPRARTFIFGGNLEF